MVPALACQRQPAVAQRPSYAEMGENASQGTAPDRHGSTNTGLDEESFRNFAPLLAASQDYAGQSGFRFSSTSFDDLDSYSAVLAATTAAANATQDDEFRAREQRLAAKLHAAPAVRCFGERLRNGDPKLSKELEDAFSLVVAESARNMMIATVKGLGLFPPCPAPPGIEMDDCSYQDASAPLPVIAQRLYNDQVRRLCEADSGRVCDTDIDPKGQQRKAQTAAFLVDFAHQAGTPVPPVPETYQSLLREFSQRTSEWSAAEAAKQAEEFGKRDGQATQAGWLGRWQSAIWAMAGTFTLGAAAKPDQNLLDSSGTGSRKVLLQEL